MSEPRNPLDKYRSYSYHHILMVSNSTESLRGFTTVNVDGDRSLENITNTGIGQAIPNPGGATGDAFLLIDTRRTSSFSIRDITYQTSPGSGVPSQSHIYLGQLEMSVVDPDGIVFINFLKHLMDTKLKCNLFGLTFLLKTMFIGHTFEDTTELITTSTIPLFLIDIEFEVSYKEGLYHLKFSPMMQSIGSMIDKFAKVKDVRSVTTTSAATLGSAISSLEDRLNETYREHYKTYNPSNQVAGENPEPAKKVGKLIQVMITLPTVNALNPQSSNWADFKMSTAADKNFETVFKAEVQRQEKDHNTKIDADYQKQVEAAKKDEKVVPTKKSISFSPNFNVFDILNMIFKSCPQVVEMANNKAKTDGGMKMYKTLTSITSNDEIVVLHFDVVEFLVPNINTNEKTKQPTNDRFFKTDDKGEKTPLNSIVYDYIFTGKNTDIIDFGLKMQHAQLLILNNQKTGVRTQNAVLNQKNQDQKPTTEEKQDVEFFNENDIIFFPTETVEQKINNANMKPNANQVEQSKHQNNKNEWLKSVSQMHMVSALDIKMIIRGNPHLMNKYTIEQIPEHGIPDSIKMSDALVSSEDFKTSKTISSALSSSKIKHREWIEKYSYGDIQAELNAKAQGKNEEITGPKAYLAPMFVKVNVFAPNVTDMNFNLFGTNDRYVQFWYDGWYFVRNITNKFSDGMFTQELSMGSFDIYGQQASSVDGSPPKNTGAK